MKQGLLRSVLAFLLLFVVPAQAAEEDPEPVGFTGARLPKLDLPAQGPVSPTTEDTTPEAAASLHQVGMSEAERIARGAEALKLDPVFVKGVHDGLQLLYRREYQATRRHFRELEQRFPGTVVGAVADTLVWQALMLENFDLRYDKQYRVSAQEARKGLEAALKQPGGEAWERTLLGGLLGIEAIHALRQMQIVNALQLAFNAMDHIGKARELAPDFVDLQLADGMYNYWRSVFTMTSNMLPSFEDRRLEGIQQMQAVQEGGVFLAPLANMALTYTWREEGELGRAVEACERNRREYPDSIINNLLLGSTYTQMRQYGRAMELFERVRAVDPQNDRVRYMRGVALMRSGKLDEARAEFQTYLNSEHLEKYQRSAAHYRMGQVYNRMNRHADAYQAFRAATRVDGHKGAKRAMARLDQRKKAGEIRF